MNEDEGGVSESDVNLTNFEQWLIQCLGNSNKKFLGQKIYLPRNIANLA